MILKFISSYGAVLDKEVVNWTCYLAYTTTN